MGRTGLLLDPGVDACGSVYTPIWKMLCVFRIYIYHLFLNTKIKQRQKLSKLALDCRTTPAKQNKGILSLIRRTSQQELN
jgi:hypothetical protein